VSLPLSRVIAGLDPAIQEDVMNAGNFARPLDRRVKPGDDGLRVQAAGARSSAGSEL